MAQTAKNTFKAALQLAGNSWDNWRNSGWGLAANAMYMHSSNRLPISLQQPLHTAAAKVDKLMATYTDPVLYWAREANYDPKIDSAWRLKMFKENDLDDIMNGHVDFKAYMGDRYSKPMEETARWWARARYEMPRQVGYTPRSRYDEYRRHYYDTHKPMFSQSGVDASDPEKLYGRFLHQRMLDADMDLPHARVDKSLPDLSIFVRDMHNQATQKVFQPIKMVNGKAVLEENSLLEKYWQASHDENLTADERDAARMTYDLVTNKVDWGNTFTRLLGNHADNVLTQNMGAAYSNFIALATLPESNSGTIAKAIQLRNADPATRKMLGEARLMDQIHFLKSFSDPTNIQIKKEGLDLYKLSEDFVRQTSYIAQAMDVAEKRGIPWEEVTAGKTERAMEVRGAALKEIQDTQGTAHRFSVRGGKTLAGVPGSFHLKNAKVSEMGRTVAQARQAMDPAMWKEKGFIGAVRPIVQNVGVRLALGGGRAFIDPTTASLLRGLVPQLPLGDEDKARLEMSLSNIATGSEELDLRWMGFKDTFAQPVQALDHAMGTNLSGRASLFGVNALPGAEVLTGRTAGINLEQGVRGAADAFNTDKLPSERFDAAMQAGATLSPFLPVLGRTRNVGGVKVSTPMMFNMLKSFNIMSEGAKGEARMYDNQGIEVKPGEAIQPFMYGNVEEQVVRNRDFDKAYMKDQLASDILTAYNTAAQQGQTPQDGSIISPATKMLVKNYLRVYGDMEYKAHPPEEREALLYEDLLKKSSGPLEKSAREDAKRVWQSANSGNMKQWQQRMNLLEDKVHRLQTMNPVMYGELTSDDLLENAAK